MNPLDKPVHYGNGNGAFEYPIQTELFPDKVQVLRSKLHHNCDQSLQESRMREIRTSGLMRGSAGIGLTAALYSLLYAKKARLSNPVSVFGCGYSAPCCFVLLFVVIYVLFVHVLYA